MNIFKRYELFNLCHICLHYLVNG